MTGEASALPTYHRPADVARMLRCSEWWVKEQARQRRIPYSWIGGSYLFTDEHVIEIVRLFEVRPAHPADSKGVVRMPVRLVPDGPDVAAPVVLRARTPRRARAAAASESSAA
jgi:hypothetical protein